MDDRKTCKQIRREENIEVVGKLLLTVSIIGVYIYVISLMSILTLGIITFLLALLALAIRVGHYIITDTEDFIEELKFYKWLIFRK